jgi:HEAT repeat protein
MILPRIYPLLGFLAACFLVALSAEAPPADSGTLILDQVWTGKLSAGAEALWKTAALDPSRLYMLSVSIEAVSLPPDDSISLSFEGAQLQLKKRLHAGDPSYFTTVRPRANGPAVLRLVPSFSQGPAPALRLELRGLQASRDEAAAFEAEPNDSWQEANPLVLGRTVYGGADDIEYLNNQEEYKTGWDWFALDYSLPEPKLVFFELDLPDRDIPLQLLFYRYNEAGAALEPYTRGKDPMEVLHDGQKIRYSKFISRVLTRGRYYVAVLGNHPFYQLRTTMYPVPPYQEPGQAVEAAMHYAAAIGDAWFAQVPRLGSRYRRSVMLHDEAQRCTACHPTVFPLESNLTGFQQGYPIRAKSQFQYLIDRVYNAPTPLYGNPGVNWVRFVGIELQFFGKQGGLVLDYENSVTGRQTPHLRRFTGFLQAAWDHRDTLPEDENNGVSPLDSKFGFAWRDWRVLDEQARRAGDAAARKSADHIAQILMRPDAPGRIQGTQDRLHRLHALALLDRRGHAGEIEKEIRYFLARQNADGGWPGNEERPSGGEKPTPSTESFEYLTGQTIHTLLTAGVSESERARLEQAARWLMSRQQEFGGWFQTETIENFVTPMRETRYAIMALARLHPARKPNGRGLGNRDGRPARLPRTGSAVEILDDLDNLWDVPEENHAQFVARIAPLLGHDNSFVRALAAQCLGRIGSQAAVEKLSPALADPEKMVWQSAAWALRRLGNRGLGLNAIRAALKSPDPNVRRGAARIFAYQFYGMDDRVDLRDPFFSLLSDPDLLTRHQAVSTLAQWWYRTDDRNARARIFQAFVDRLAHSGEHPLQRSYLSQGIYNLLDENLGAPGTGYGRWISYLRPERQAALRAERRRQEQEILLKPILRALVEGPEPQRLGVLLGFDGTPFWRGYTTAAFGPGNDRIFNFESGNDFEGLARSLQSVLARRESPEELGYGLRLAAFFNILRGPQVAPLYLDALSHPSPGVREAAAEIADKVRLGGESETLGKLIEAAGNSASRPSVLKLLRANPSLLERKELADVVRRSAGDPKLGSIALPLMAAPGFSDAEALAALLQSWPRAIPEDGSPTEASKQIEARNSLLSRQVLEASRRRQAVEPPRAFLDCLSLMEQRPGLLKNTEVLGKLGSAAVVDNGKARQLVFELLLRHPEIAAHPSMIPLVRPALRDNRAEVRRASLGIAARSPEVSRLPEFPDDLLRLLLDPDARVRAAALEIVVEENWVRRDPRLTGRIKALELGERDPAARQRASEALRLGGLDPVAVKPTADLAKPALPDFELFRRTVNPHLYRESAKDQRACAHCHATHRIFRLVEPPGEGAELAEQAIEKNYHSILKVIDAYEPERSLVLRKPLSPSGQGEEDASSPTGLTHVGGTRWSGVDDPAYQAILRWVRSPAP